MYADHMKTLKVELIWLSGRLKPKASAVDARIIALEREVYEGNERLRRLYKAMEDGVTEMDDILKDRIIDPYLRQEKTEAGTNGPS